MNMMVTSHAALDLQPPCSVQEQCSQLHLSFALVPCAAPEFESILALRKAAYKTDKALYPDAIDIYSEHYLALNKGMPVAAIRVTRRAMGPLDCQDHYPQLLLDMYGNIAASSSRFVASPVAQNNPKISRLLLEVAWWNELQLGVRLDIINVHERSIRYYGRKGYVLIAGSAFQHPQWKTPSRVMLLPATSARASDFRHLFSDLSDRLSYERMFAIVEIDDWRDFKYRRHY